MKPRHAVLFWLCISSLSLAKPTVIIVGDSLTEGFNEDRASSYVGRLEEFLRKEKGSEARVIAAGSAGETSAGLRKLIEFQLSAQKDAPKPDLVILAMGANDALRGLKLEMTRANYEDVIKFLKEKKIPIALAGMKAPPNLGEDYKKPFDLLFPNLAKKYKLPLIPFLLQDVAGVPSLNQADGIHPNVAGHEKIAKNLLPFVLKALR